jgi:hypothetical protein
MIILPTTLWIIIYETNMHGFSFKKRFHVYSMRIKLYNFFIVKYTIFKN